MRCLVLVITVTALLSVPSTALAGSSSPEGRAHALFAAADRFRAKSEEVESPTRKLAILERELRELRRTYGFIRSETVNGELPALAVVVERRLVGALNQKTRLYMERGSLAQARSANRAALAYPLADVGALKLRYVLDRAGKRELIDEADGTVGIQRLRERRSAAGQPLRERGLSRRR